jgi:hypothetical protein
VWCVCVPLSLLVGERARTLSLTRLFTTKPRDNDELTFVGSKALMCRAKFSNFAKFAQIATTLARTFLVCSVENEMSYYGNKSIL